MFENGFEVNDHSLMQFSLYNHPYILTFSYACHYSKLLQVCSIREKSSIIEETTGILISFMTCKTTTRNCPHWISGSVNT